MQVPTLTTWVGVGELLGRCVGKVMNDLLGCLRHDGPYASSPLSGHAHDAEHLHVALSSVD